MLGQYLHQLVKSELRAQQFEIRGENTNTLDGKDCKPAKYTLDIIAKHRTKPVTIGVEIKNTLDLIPLKELNKKIDMCKTLRILPVFACRWLKPYEKIILKNRGFPWIFKKQIYPLGQENFVKKLKKKLELPIEVSSELPKDSVKDLKRWVNKITL